MSKRLTRSEAKARLEYWKKRQNTLSQEQREKIENQMQKPSIRNVTIIIHR